MHEKFSYSLTHDNEPSTSDARKERTKITFNMDFYTVKEMLPKVECIIYEEMPSNKSMIPSKLLCHLNLNHCSCAKKDNSLPSPLGSLLDQWRKQKQSLLSSVPVSDKALELVTML